VSLARRMSPVQNTGFLQRSMQYASTFGYTVCVPGLLPGAGCVAASGAFGYSHGFGAVAAETIGLLHL
jgi:hypothetical protein